MASTPFDLLPHDCWVQVLEYLSQRDLNFLSRTCRDFNAITTPYLYQSFHWDWKYPPVQKILLLLRSISERTELANHVWHLSLVWWDATLERTQVWIPQGCAEWANVRRQLEATLRWARDIVRDARFPPKLADKWDQGLSAGDPYACATLLLSQLHNLRSLRLDFSFALTGGLPGNMLHHSLFGNAPPGVLTQLMKLEKVDYASNIPLVLVNHNFDFGKNYQFMPWFHLPSLKVLEMWLKSVRGVCPSPLEKTPSPTLDLSKLCTLVITRSTLPCDYLATLISQVPYLRSLHIGTVLPCIMTTECYLQSYRVLLDALETSSKTLEHLSVSVELFRCCKDKVWAGADEINHEHFHDLLRKFRKLKMLSVPLRFLIDWDDMLGPTKCPLPENLEEIDLRVDLWKRADWARYEDIAINTLAAWIEQRGHGTYRSLRTLSYEGLTTEPPEFQLFLKRQALHLFSMREGVEMFARGSDWTPLFMIRMVEFVNNVPVGLPWPFVHAEELPVRMPLCFTSRPEIKRPIPTDDDDEVFDRLKTI
jgi:hypothetical protein